MPPTLSAYLRLTRLDRPIGAFLLLWPTLWALWLAADGRPDATIVVIFIAGTLAMRAAGCVLNDYADRRFDGRVERTRNRPLVTGEISGRAALGCCCCLLLVALLLVMQLNWQTRAAAVLAALVAAIYPYCKRFTHLPQLVLGVAFSFGIPMAYLALRTALPLEAGLLWCANFAWIVAYDTQYAMADRPDDVKIGVKSSAILFGRYDNLIVGLLHLSSLTVLAIIGYANGFSWHYYLALGLALCCAVYQQVLCQHRERAQCLRAFQNNNWFGAVIFAGIVLVA